MYSGKDKGWEPYVGVTGSGSNSAFTIGIKKSF